MNKAYRIAICGASQVGKTSIFKRLVGKDQDHDYNHYNPTMGVDCDMQPQGSHNIIYYDFSGDETYYKMTIPYILSIDLFLMVYNIYDKNTINTLDALYKKYIELGWSGEMLVIGNKKDQSTHGNMIDNILEGDQFADKIQVSHITVSAKYGEDIMQLQDAIRDIMNPRTRSKVTYYPNPKHRKKSCLFNWCTIL